VADGYSGSHSTFCFDDQVDSTQFTQDEIHELFQCGTLGRVKRNDETGPDTYTEGECMPGLTLAGVYDELVGK